MQGLCVLLRLAENRPLGGAARAAGPLLQLEDDHVTELVEAKEVECPSLHADLSPDNQDRFLEKKGRNFVEKLFQPVLRLEWFDLAIRRCLSPK